MDIRHRPGLTKPTTWDMGQAKDVDLESSSYQKARVRRVGSCPGVSERSDLFLSKGSKEKRGFLQNYLGTFSS